MHIVIYHNPRCSKSRQTLALIRERGVEPEVVEYLREPPDAATLRRILGLLGVAPHELLRRGERLYAELGLADLDLDEEMLIEAVVANPVLIERPVVVAGGRAVLGRPPERGLGVL
jgi:arsenate reductase